ncbi:MAG: hypothetical protein NW241_10905 [Bacteroidia bacterium]|nr:hypothetical protein [Bacteroidia bacterium]
MSIGGRIGDQVYQGYLLVFIIYGRSLTRAEKLFERVPPLVVLAGLLAAAASGAGRLASAPYAGSLISILSVLLGFSIAAFTVVATASGEAIDLAKGLEVCVVLKNRVTLYTQILISYAYTILLELFVIGAGGIYLLFQDAVPVQAVAAANVLLLMTMLHIFLSIVRNTTSLALVFFNNRIEEPRRPLVTVLEPGRPDADEEGGR